MNRKITKFDIKKKEITVEPDMSLTRDEWCEIWERIKTIEQLLTENYSITNAKRDIMIYEIEEIKAKIQKVIGQME